MDIFKDDIFEAAKDAVKPKPRPFNAGQLIVTDAVVELMERSKEFQTFVYCCYIRYRANDWGDVSREAAKFNKRNLKHGGNLGGQYISSDGMHKLTIITTESRDRTVIDVEKVDDIL